jgi:hypothetical protein
MYGMVLHRPSEPAALFGTEVAFSPLLAPRNLTDIPSPLAKGGLTQAGACGKPTEGAALQLYEQAQATSGGTMRTKSGTCWRLLCAVLASPTFTQQLIFSVQVAAPRILDFSVTNKTATSGRIQPYGKSLLDPHCSSSFDHQCPERSGPDPNKYKCKWLGYSLPGYRHRYRWRNLHSVLIHLFYVRS